MISEEARNVGVMPVPVGSTNCVTVPSMLLAMRHVSAPWENVAVADGVESGVPATVLVKLTNPEDCSSIQALMSASP